MDDHKHHTEGRIKNFFFRNPFQEIMIPGLCMASTLKGIVNIKMKILTSIARSHVDPNPCEIHSSMKQINTFLMKHDRSL